MLGVQHLQGLGIGVTLVCALTYSSVGLYLASNVNVRGGGRLGSARGLGFR